MKRVLPWLTAVFFVGSLALAWMMVRERTAPDLTPPPAAVPAVALTALYDAALPDTSGRMQRIGQWRDRILVVNYWATWCTPCRDEMPAFSRLQERYGARGVQFVGIAIDEADKVREFARDFPVSYPLLVADREFAETSRALGNVAQAVPYTVVLDRAGNVQAGTAGRVDEDALARLLDRLTGT